MLISKFEGTNIEKIVQLEMGYGVELPSQYKNFLLRYNGGFTPETRFKSNKVSSDVRAFYGLGDVDFSLNSLDLQALISLDLFPVACDSFGNYVVLGIHGDVEGNVFFLDHEIGKVQRIADDLKSFVKLCKSKRISPDVRMSIEEREADLISRGRGHVITDGLRKMWQQEIDMYGNIVQERVVVE